MKNKLISIVRVGTAVIVGSVVSWLASHNLIDAEMEQLFADLVATLSFIVGSIVYYALSRFAQDYLPWLLLLPDPNAPVKLSRFSSTLKK